MIPLAFKWASAAVAVKEPSGSKWTRMKFPTLSVTVRPNARTCSVNQGVANGGCAGGDRCGIDIEWPAHAVEHAGNVSRTVNPAQPQGGQSVDLGKRARHDRVLGGCDNLQARFIIVSFDVLCIRGIENKQDMFGQRCA